jgi:hypothetical protein
MFFHGVSSGDRLAAAQEHFRSAGMSAGKIVLLIVLACIAGFLIYYAYRKK